MNNTSFITKIDYLGPHRITTTGQNGINYSISNISSIDNNCSDSLCVKDQKKDKKITIDKSEGK